MIASGLIIFFGIVFITLKIKRKWFLRILNYPLAFDIVVAAVVYALHWGTFSGVMAAAVAVMLLHCYTSAMRWAWGYHDGKQHITGKFNIQVMA